MEENIDCKADEPKARPLVSPALIFAGFGILMAGFALMRYFKNEGHKVRILTGEFEKRYRKTPRMKKPRKERRIYRRFYKSKRGKILKKFLNKEISK